MTANTKIEWADHTFNGHMVCQEVGAECDNCYAKTSLPVRAMKLGWGPKVPRQRTSADNWKEPFRWHRAHAAFFKQHGRHQRVFGYSLADWADTEAPLQWAFDFFDMVRSTPDLHYMLLTKRIGNVIELARAAGGWPKNAALGVSAGTQSTFDRDVRKLQVVACELNPLWTFVSMGPLLERVGIQRHQLDLIDQVIVEGESGRGPNIRPMAPAWPREIRDACQGAGVSFFFKQWGRYLPVDVLNDGDWLQAKAIEGCGEFVQRDKLKLRRAHDQLFADVGKETAGRLLDGRIWSQYPVVTQ